MKNKKVVLILCIVCIALDSCIFFPVASKYHYYTAIDNTEKDIPEVTIFSTPGTKSYVVTDVDMNSEVFISSPAFPDTGKFYLMEKKDFFEKKAMQYEFARSDHRYYKNPGYKNITLKVINGENEKIITYKIIEK